MKNEVMYTPDPRDQIRIGYPALLWNVLDHPSRWVSNIPNTPVITSLVHLIEYKGGKIYYFETLNSIYRADRRGSAKIAEVLNNIDDVE